MTTSILAVENTTNRLSCRKLKMMNKLHLSCFGRIPSINFQKVAQGRMVVTAVRRSGRAVWASATRIDPYLHLATGFVKVSYTDAPPIITNFISARRLSLSVGRVRLAHKMIITFYLLFLLISLFNKQQWDQNTHVG